jgi:hypothetical protein
MKIVLLVVGPLFVAVGLFWFGQGTGLFSGPHNAGGGSSYIGWDHESQSSSRSRRTAFFDLSQAFDDPLRYGESSRFETMPSRPNRQT